jgi:hypothetical protein
MSETAKKKLIFEAIRNVSALPPPPHAINIFLAEIQQLIFF